jgi:hypothetical protein
MKRALLPAQLSAGSAGLKKPMAARFFSMK